MNKKIIIGLIVLIVLGAGIFVWQCSKRANDKKFLSQLKGEVVFARRDNEVLNIYKINANGTGEKLLYHNEKNQNAYLPFWSKDKRKINFTVFYNNKARKAFMEKDGSDVQILEEKGFYINRDSRAKDIVVQKGSVYWKDKSGKFHQVYYFPNQNYKLNPGASEASWSPDRKYIIFDVCSTLNCKIMIAKKDGSKVVELTKGRDPDWKY